ncbi:MAG: hypothetical protein ACOY30_07885 [Bacillota bacterium]
MEVIFTDITILLVILAVLVLLFIIKLIKGAIRLAFVLAILGLALWYSSRFL